jgi:hypothetical protein
MGNAMLAEYSHWSPCRSFTCVIARGDKMAAKLRHKLHAYHILHQRVLALTAMAGVVQAHSQLGTRYDAEKGPANARG